jgi:transcriptional regulator with XRE-family HTH domain
VIALLRDTITEVMGRGVTLKDLADRSGVSSPQLSRFVHRKRTLTLDNAVKLFDVLGLQVVKGPAPILPAPPPAQSSLHPTRPAKGKTRRRRAD